MTSPTRRDFLQQSSRLNAGGALADSRRGQLGLHLRLRGLRKGGGQAPRMRNSRGEEVSSSQPCFVTRTLSSMRTPPQPLR